MYMYILYMYTYICVYIHTYMLREFIYMYTYMHDIDRSVYARRHIHEGVLHGGTGMAFENWSKLEVGYPISSLICKLQEIRGIGLAWR